MKVLFDMSVVGFGQLNSLAKTGIARVVENLAHGLALSTECSLSFSDSLSLKTLQALISYRSKVAAFQSIPILHSNHTILILNKISELYNLSQLNHVGIMNDDIKNLIEQISKLLSENYVYSFNYNDINDINIFHATFYRPPEFLAHANIKVFSTIYDLIPIIYPQYFNNTNIAENHIKRINDLNEDDWILCISESTKNDLCNYSKKVDPEKIFVTHLAADNNMFYQCQDKIRIRSVLSKYNIPNAPYILSLCTLEPRKNINHLIKCFCRLINEINDKDLFLVLVGNIGWDTQEIFSEINNHSSLKNRIIIAGHVNDEDLAPIYSGSIVFVYPSVYEGFGLPPLEAMQCGTPVITSNNSSLPEVVNDAGIMVNASDEDALCQSILDIYHNGSLRKEMSIKSIKQAKKFSWKKCTQQTIHAYQVAMNI